MSVSPMTDNMDDAMVFHNYDDAFKALNRLPDNMWAYGNVRRVSYDFEEVHHEWVLRPHGGHSRHV